MYFVSILDELTQSFISGVRTLFYAICSFLYQLIIYLYNLFDMLSTGRILDNEFTSVLYSRVGLILGIIMLFRIIFSFIQMLLNPDAINDKEKGIFNIVKRVIITIVLLGTVPYLFDFAYRIQNVLLSHESGNSNVISRMILPYSINTDSHKFGAVFSEQLFFAFYDLDETLDDTSQEYQECLIYKGALINQIEDSQEFSLGYNCLNTTGKFTDLYTNDTETFYIMRFNYLISLVVGVLVCWFLLTYCFSLGVRIIQLAFLEIIAPMPIISYISPKKDGMFSKWAKMCLTTYLDVFIRVAIINFIILIIAMLMDGFFGDANSMFMLSTGAYTSGPWYRRFLFVIIVLALLQFAKKAPELLKELLPKSWAASGDFGFGLKNRDVLGRTLATVGGVAAGGAVGFLTERGAHRFTGALSGVGRGLGKGVSSKGSSFGEIGKTISGTGKNQYAYNSKHIGWRNNDSTFFGRLGQRAANITGMMGEAESIENQIRENEDIINTHTASINRYQNISDLESNAESRAESKLKTKVFNPGDFGYALQRERTEAETRVKTAQAELDAAAQRGDDTTAAQNRLNQAQMDLTNINDRTKKAYISGVMSGQLSDGTMLSNFNQSIASVSQFSDLFTGDNEFMSDFYNETHNADGSFKSGITQGAYDAFLGSIQAGTFTSNSSYGSCGYALLDAFEAASTNRRNERTLIVNEAKQANEAIKDSPRYRIAQQNRNAAGGQSGKK